MADPGFRRRRVRALDTGGWATVWAATSADLDEHRILELDRLVESSI